MRKVISLLVVVCMVLTLLLLLSVNGLSANTYNIQTVINIATHYANIGATDWKNLCLGFVNHCFNEAYGISSSSCCAYNYGSRYIDSTSLDNIPIGADVFFGGSDIICKCGNYAGHVGIYVGDGYVIHSWSGRVQKSSISYIINCGYPYRGYGWHADAEFYGTYMGAKLLLEKNNFTTSEHITFYFSNNNCTHKNLRIFRDNELIETLSTSEEHITKTYAVPGTYSAYYDAVNTNSVIETSEMIYFTVQEAYAPPSNVSLSLEKNEFLSGEQATFYCSGKDVLYYILTVYKDGEVLESKKINPFSYYTGYYDDVASYTAYVEAFNASGSTFSSTISFKVTAKAELLLEKQNFTTTEHTTFYFSCSPCTHKNLRIFRDNVLIETPSTSEPHLVRSYTVPGTYSAYFDAVATDSIIATSEMIYFTVQEAYAPPSNVSLTLNKTEFLVGEPTTFYCSGTDALYYILTVYKDGEILESKKINPYTNYTAYYDDAASYSARIEAFNVSGSTASDTVSFEVISEKTVTYTVQYFQQKANGKGYVLSDQKVLDGISGETATAPVVSYDGFTENTAKGTVSGTIAKDGSLVLSRYFDRNTYSIKFEMNGGSTTSTIKALYEAPVTAPDEPSKEGYDFGGWYADEDFEEEFVFNTMPLGGAKVYAKWDLRGIEYQINGIILKSSSTYEVIDSIPDSSFLVEVSVTNVCADDTDAVILAYYKENGQYIGMQYLYTKSQAGQTMRFGASVDNTKGEIAKIKAFVLPTLGSPIPLANSAEVK